MNDEELPINDELASAYLDDVLDPAGRAIASADPDVMATVESFARVRAALGEVAPVAGSAKNAALAAALAEFETRRVAPVAADAPAATVTSLRSRRRTYRALTSVAAAVAILAIGIAAINGARGNDSSNSSADRPSSAATDTISLSAKAPGLTPGLKVSASTAAAGGTAAPSAAGTLAASTAGGDATASATVAPLQIDTKAALAEYAASIEGIASPTPQSPTTTVRAGGAFVSTPVRCLTSSQVVIGGPITVNGTLAYAVRDTSSGALQAIDAADCSVLLNDPGP